jgi:peptidoglycan/xylan/chitin deacetylase (PgdA/CDA1 family)
MCTAQFDSPALALTFDDGPTETTSAVLDLLKK